MICPKRQVLNFFHGFKSIRLVSSSPDSTTKLQGCLSDITILDLTRILAGPFCTMLLSDLGAKVIKVEKPGKGDETRSWGPPYVNGDAAYYLSINRNKKSIAVDFKKAEGLKILEKLVAQSDVFIENYIPGKLSEMGLGYDDLSKINPGIIYCSISGFGPTGPYARRAGFDVIAASMGGLLAITGPEGGAPCKVGVASTDLSTGLYAHGAILAALHQRTHTGLGMKIDCNLLSTQVSLLANLGVGYLNAGLVPQRRGTAHENVVPYQAFKCADGKYITICAGSDKMFHSICKVVFPSDEAEKVINDPKFVDNASRNVNRKELVDLIEKALARKPMQEWLKDFEGTGISYGPVNDVDLVFKDPQVIHNESVINVDHNKGGKIKLLGPAVKYQPLAPNLTAFREKMTSPPDVGEHTIQVLEQLGYDQKSIEQLKEKKIIQCSK